MVAKETDMPLQLDADALQRELVEVRFMPCTLLYISCYYGDLCNYWNLTVEGERFTISSSDRPGRVIRELVAEYVITCLGTAGA